MITTNIVTGIYIKFRSNHSYFIVTLRINTFYEETKTNR